MKLIRQGEVALIKIDNLPKNLKEKDKVLAIGESKNHKHQFISEQVQVFADKNNQQFVQVNQPSKLIHEEHHALKIPKGKYKIILQREFDLMQNIKQVMD